MGVSQSTPSCLNSHKPISDDMNDFAKHDLIRPYGLAKNSRHLTLNSSSSTFYSGIISLVQGNKYADLLIFCGDDRYPVHRAIVCPRSHFFTECCALVEGEIDHASPGRPTKIWIDPSECESNILAAVLTFLYTLDYMANGPQILTFGLPQVSEDEDTETEVSTIHSLSKLDVEEEPSVIFEDDARSVATSVIDTPASTASTSRTSTPVLDPGESPNELVFHTRMYIAAQRFGIVSLCDTAKEKFEKRLRTGPWNVEMLACIREVYKYGNGLKISSLKDEVVKFARQRFRVLKGCEGWDELVLEFPMFAKELLRRM